jgi:hypothetical protein
VSIANPDAGACRGLGNGRRGNPRQVETDRRHALRELRFVADAVDRRSRLAQHPQQRERQALLVVADAGHRGVAIKPDT